MKLPKLVAAIFFALLGSGKVDAQSNPQQTTPSPTTPAQRATASIYVTASTKKGMLIRDLRPEDIIVTEDKVPAKIDRVNCGRPEPLLVGILVDVSGSRRSDPHLASHYDALHGFVNQVLTGDDAAFLVDYGPDAYQLSEATADRAAISVAFDKLKKDQPRGSTATYDAVYAAADQYFFGPPRHRVLVVVGDWEDNSSRVRLEEAVKAAQKSASTIYAIVDADTGWESKKAHKNAVNAATEATEQTGGLVYDVREKNDFDKAVQAIGAAVVGSCRVEYTTPGIPETKKGVKLHVQANSKDISILYPRVRFISFQ